MGILLGISLTAIIWFLLELTVLKQINFYLLFLALLSLAGFFPLERRANLYWQGMTGEKYAQDEIEGLIKNGYEIINDVPGDKFNVDLLVIGPSGVYVIEVKNPTKTKDDKVVYQNGGIYIGPKDLDPKSDKFQKVRRSLNKRNPVEQVIKTAGWVKRLLEDSGRKKVTAIQPVVLFPKFWVENYIGDVWVMNSKTFALEAPRHQEVLQPQEIHELTSIIRAHIQAKIPMGND